MINGEEELIGTRVIGKCISPLVEYLELLGNKLKDDYQFIQNSVSGADDDIIANRKLEKLQEPLPKWWPKRKSTKQKWALIFKKDIKYLYMDGEKISYIAKKAKYGRHHVSHIIQWANTNPEELIR